MSLPPFPRRSARAVMALTLMLPLVACGATQSADVEYDYPTSLGRKRERIAGGTGLFSGEDGFVNFLGSDPGDSQGGPAGIGVNAFLWRAALDTTSFMPTLQADPVGGTILKDWYSPDGSTAERFKVDIFITGTELSADALRVQVFRQQRAPSGEWLDSPVARQTSTQLEDAILARARELRSGA